MPIARRPLTIAACLAAVATTGAAAAAPAPPAHHGPTARIVSPRDGATVTGAVRPRLRVPRRAGVRRLELRIDGRLVASWSPRAHRAPLWSTATLRNGTHRLEVRTVRAGGFSRDVRYVTVENRVTAKRRPRPAPAPAAPTPQAPASPAPAIPTVPKTPIPAPPPSASGLDIPGTILRVGDFNTGDLSQWSGHQSLRSYSLTLVPAAREGAYAARFEVRRGDDPLCAAGYGCFGDRSEVQMSTNEAEGQERWYSWSTMIGADFPRYPNWQVISQWHAQADGSPPIGLYAENDDLVLQFHRFSSPGHPIDIVNAWRGSLRRGQWQDIRLHVKWSGSDSVGFVELWINGQQQTFDNGQTRRYIRTMYPGISNYFKQGLYRQGGLSATGVVYHDGFRMSRP